VEWVERVLVTGYTWGGGVISNPFRESPSPQGRGEALGLGEASSGDTR